MKMLVLALLAVLAFLGGAVGGEALRRSPDSEAPAPAEAEAGHGEAAPDHANADAGPDDHAADTPKDHAASVPSDDAHAGDATAHAEGGDRDWFRFPNQFFVPIMRNGATGAVMVLSLTLEMQADAATRIAAQEHRLRDALLNALMIEANTGGFDGNFTSEASLTRLRRSLLGAAQKAAGPGVGSVLIEDIARQEQ